MKHELIDDSYHAGSLDLRCKYCGKSDYRCKLEPDCGKAEEGKQREAEKLEREERAELSRLQTQFDRYKELKEKYK